MYILSVVILVLIVKPGWAQQAQESYSELLKQAIARAGSNRAGVFQFLSPSAGWYPPGPHFAPIVGLSYPDAVPFLLDVLQNGPDWPDDEFPERNFGIYRYVARCYAALCLGSIGDMQAYEPLLTVLNNTALEPYKYGANSTRKGEYNLRSYAAFAIGCLGDRRAVKPLIKSLRQDGFVECIYALARLEAVTAVPDIVKVASDRNLFNNVDVHHCLEYILQVKFTLRTAGEDYRYKVIDQFPEVGTVHLRDAYRTLWQHWIKAGDKYAKEQFKEFYPQWKAALKNKPNAPARHRVLQQRMLKGGVAAVPYLMDEIEKGDASSIPVAAKLTKPRAHRIKDVGPQLSEKATQKEAKEWWKKNKQKWTIFQPAETEE